MRRAPKVVVRDTLEIPRRGAELQTTNRRESLDDLIGRRREDARGRREGRIRFNLIKPRQRETR